MKFTLLTPLQKIEGKKEGNRNYGRRIIDDIPMPDMSKLVDREKLVVPVTKIASFQLRKMIEWFADEKEQRNDHSFRNNHTCLLALSCYILMEVPENMKLFGLQARSNMDHNSKCISPFY